MHLSTGCRSQVTAAQTRVEELDFNTKQSGEKYRVGMLHNCFEGLSTAALKGPAHELVSDC